MPEPFDCSRESRVDPAIAALTAPGSTFEITSTRHHGVPWRVFPHAPASLASVFDATTRAHAAREHLVHEGGRITFGEHRAAVAALAARLAGEAGVGKGDRVAVAMRNHPEFAAAFWAAQVLGAVAVPLNAWWTADELCFALDDCGACVLVADGERMNVLAGRLTTLKHLRIAYTVHGEDGPNALDLTPSRPLHPELPDVPVAPDDIATILYTSGTTGRPKGAIGTHRNHTTNLHTTRLLQALAWARAGLPVDALAAGLQPDLPRTSVLLVYPLFHIAGLSVLYTAAADGAKLTLMRRWDTGRALDLVEQEAVTSASMVPTLLRRLLESPERDAHDLSSLVTLGGGGAPVPPDLVDAIGRLAVTPRNAYGMTETSCVVAVNSGADYQAHPDSVGRPVPVVDVRITDPVTGADVAPGQAGELLLRGPHITPGYWNRPDADEEAFVDGWFRTGDLTRRDAEGFLHIDDRLKDVIIRGGENVSSAEVEAVLFTHPAVADVAVVGVPHRDLGEEVAAVVRVRAGAAVTAAELRGHVARRLAAFKVPTLVRFTDVALPRNAVGKVLKRDLRDMLAT